MEKVPPLTSFDDQTAYRIAAVKANNGKGEAPYRKKSAYDCIRDRVVSAGRMKPPRKT